MTLNEKEKFKELLLEERKDILDNLVSDDEALNELNVNGEGDLADQAYNYYEKNLLLGITNTEKETLRKIDEALSRVDDGDYGVCEVCKNPIETERLEAVPYTTLCIKHSRERSKKRGR